MSDDAAKTKAHYRKVRAELASMLGFGSDLAKLPVGQVMRLDTVFALKLSLDEMRARLLRGETVDTAKMLAASEALERYLPKVADARVTESDAREKLWTLIMNARAADQHEQGEVEVTALQEAERRIASLEDEIKHLRGVKPRHLPPPADKPLDKQATKLAATPAKAEPAAPECGKPADCSWLKPVPQVDASQRVNGGPPQTRSGDETKAAMDRVNSDRSAFYQHLRPATHSEPWRDYVGPDGDISMRPRGGWGFP